MVTPVYVYDIYIYIYVIICILYIYTHMYIYIICIYSRFPYCIYISSNPSIYLSTRMHIHTHTNTHTHTHMHTHDTGVGIRIRIQLLRTHTHTYTLRHIPTYISESWPAGAGSLCRLMKLLISRREHRLFALPFTKETRLIGDISWRSRNCPCSEDLPIVARFVHYMLPVFLALKPARTRCSSCFLGTATATYSWTRLLGTNTMMLAADSRSKRKRTHVVNPIVQPQVWRAYKFIPPLDLVCI